MRPQYSYPRAGWREMSSAPRDGREILVITHDGDIHVCTWRKDQGGFWWSRSGACLRDERDGIRWSPLPDTDDPLVEEVGLWKSLYEGSVKREENLERLYNERTAPALAEVERLKAELAERSVPPSVMTELTRLATSTDKSLPEMVEAWTQLSDVVLHLRSELAMSQQQASVLERERVPNGMPVAEAVRQMILEGMRHELDEVTVVDGKRIYDPHARQR